MKNCCSSLNFQCCEFQDKLNFTYEETDKGIKVYVEPKDASKIEPFKKFISACRDFSDGKCC